MNGCLGHRQTIMINHERERHEQNKDRWCHGEWSFQYAYSSPCQESTVFTTEENRPDVQVRSHWWRRGDDSERGEQSVKIQLRASLGFLASSPTEHKPREQHV